MCVCVSEKLKTIFWPEQIGTIYSGCINYYVLFFIWYENKLVDSSYTFLNIPSVAIDSLIIFFYMILIITEKVIY